MTTIAYRSRVLCTDSACTSASGILLGTVRKVTRCPDGSIIAAAGKSLACAAILAWAESGMPPGELATDGECNALLVDPSGRVYHVGADGSRVQIDGPYHAEGTGFQLAMGAMDMGATAEQAVQIACRRDGKSSGPIQTISLDLPDA